LANPISPDHLLSSFGLAGLTIILFAECGLLIGFFLPGDTLLFAAGIKIAVDPGSMSPLGAFLVVAPIGAIVGNLVGYWIGYRAGPVVFDRPDSRFFRPEYVTRSQAFFERFGTWTIILGRFVPIVRTVATVMAGVARMRFASYAIYSAIGGVLWADGVLLLGHQLGKIKFVQDNKGYVDIAVIAVVALSLIPAAFHYLQSRRRTPGS
ncbi:MAG TPA: DedA family protein, partial [Jatrophihabitantaceae bacterium]|nr:DedA family protein [Jatrophihabitantaceae bacterium]